MPNAICSRKVDEHGRVDSECLCKMHFQPVYDADRIMQCKGPIPLAKYVNDICIVDDDCGLVSNTECISERIIKFGEMREEIKSCRCKMGFKADDNLRKCKKVPLAAIITSGLISKITQKQPSRCLTNYDCEHISNSYCPKPSDEELFSTCKCLHGTYGFFSGDVLMKCEDPIVKTASVKGFCLWDKHCRELNNTSCLRENPSNVFGRCHCNKGFVPKTQNNNLIAGCYPSENNHAIMTMHSFEEQEKFTAIIDSIESIASVPFHPLLITTRPPAPSVVERNSGHKGCQRKAIVVESEEWSPEIVTPMRLDKSTLGTIGVVHIQIPKSALPNQGCILRLQSSDASTFALTKYTIKLFNNGQVKISRSYDRNGNIVDEYEKTYQVSTRSWINSKGYTGFWIIHYDEYIGMGIIGMLKHSDIFDRSALCNFVG